MKRPLMCALLLCIVLVTATVPVMVVVAQGEAVPVMPETTFGWVLLAWVIYALLGVVANLTSTPPEKFDAVKFAGSLLSMIITFFLALLLKLTPGIVTTQFGPFIDSIATIVLNTGPGLLLIYAILRLYKFVVNLKAKLEAAHAAATGPEPIASPS